MSPLKPSAKHEWWSRGCYRDVRRRGLRPMDLCRIRFPKDAPAVLISVFSLMILIWHVCNKHCELNLDLKLRESHFWLESLTKANRYCCTALFCSQCTLRYVKHFLDSNKVSASVEVVLCELDAISNLSGSEKCGAGLCGGLQRHCNRANWERLWILKCSLQFRVNKSFTPVKVTIFCNGV